jgi:hypothetical protein
MINYSIQNKCLNKKQGSDAFRIEVINYLIKKIHAQRALCSVLLTNYHWGDHVKKTEMGRTCGTYGGEEKCIQSFSGET